MTKCDGCGKEVGNLYCGHCRTDVKKKTRIKEAQLTPLLYWDNEAECYRFGCTCIGCPANHGGVCGVLTQGRLKILFDSNRIHEFDGDNIIHQVCG